jgi:putative hydrolase of the HAD superfamily
MIRAVLFDAVGTLFQSRGTIGEIYAAAFDFQTDPAVIDAEFARLLKRRGTPLDREDWKSLVASVFAGLGPFPRFDDFFERVYTVFQTRRGWVCYPETVPVLRTLRRHRFRVGVVSNFDARLSRVLSDLEIAPYFEAVVTPHSSGYAKPDPKIFKYALALLSVRAEEAIFAGDEPLQDVEAAARVGLKSVLIDRRSQSQDDATRLRDLSGILQILEIKDSC